LVVTPSAHFAFANERQRRGEIGHHDFEAPAHQIGHGRHGSLVRGVHHANAGHAAEQLGIEVKRRA
jgi:hypothetical protein